MNRKILLISGLFVFLVSPVFFAIAHNLKVNNEITTSTAPAVKIPISPPPVFSWELTELTDIVSSFTVVVSTVSDFSSSIWTYFASTNTTNTINFITRVIFNADNSAMSLIADATYFLKVTLFSGTTSYELLGSFCTYPTSLGFISPVLDLQVDGNNPFNPAYQKVSFKFSVFDRDRTLVLRIYTLSGELVKEWPQETILKNATKVIEWDGKNTDGKPVARGVYLVNLSDVNDDKSITRKVFVVTK